MTKIIMNTIRQIDILKTIRNYYRVVIKFIELKRYWILDLEVVMARSSFEVTVQK